MPETPPYDLLAAQLWPQGERRNIWMIVDCARSEQVWSTIYASTLLRECLYTGALHPTLERAAPYLVQLELGDRHTIRLLDRGWGQSWGIFLRAGMSMHSLRRHLRKYLRVMGPGGKPLVFRYYDPRVMRVFLPTCSASQLDQVFGPIECIFAEDASPSQLLEFKINATRQRLETREISLAPPKATV